MNYKVWQSLDRRRQRHFPLPRRVMAFGCKRLFRLLSTSLLFLPSFCITLFQQFLVGSLSLLSPPPLSAEHATSQTPQRHHSLISRNFSNLTLLNPTTSILEI
ncbi:unnamed protein product, partial [Pleuronectes platessa]